MSALYRPFSTLLVANRGEIACRIMRSARRMGLKVVAVYSDADAGAPHVRMADAAVRIGRAPARESYLDIKAVLSAAHASGAEAIHPGYGFLSERAEFAEAVAAAGLVFVGPPASAIRAMGLKDAAKALVEKAGVPVVPGYHGEKQDPAFLKEHAYRSGYPVLIKAVAGGGGKGMRRVDKHADFEAALASARREAESSFGDGRVLVEKYVQAPRHIEVQVFGDSRGEVVHLFERDCSCQRRHQKVIEEAPAPGMTEALRTAMGMAAVDTARAVGYVGAGTVEFIVDSSHGLREDAFYFMEMNTRLQVEHPVTEAIAGVDLVEWQLRVAMGEALPKTQGELAIGGHAVEARLYAEDPETGFLPSTGRLWALELPKGAGIRIDSGVEEGGEVTPYYDPMIAKIIAQGETRDQALDRLSAALAETIVAGPKTNAGFLKALVDQPDFRAGRLDTGLIDRNMASLGAVKRELDGADVAAAAAALMDRATSATERAYAGDDPWSVSDAFQLVQEQGRPVAVLAEDQRLEIMVHHDPQGEVSVSVPALGYRERGFVRRATRKPWERQGREFRRTHHGGIWIAAGEEVIVLKDARQTRVRLIDALDVDIEHLGEAGSVILAPMHGRVVALDVAPGDAVEKGQRLAVVEAMKMEHALLAPRDGIVEAVLAGAGDQVNQGARLIVLTEETAA